MCRNYRIFCLVAVVLSMLLPAPPGAAAQDVELRILSYNINDLPWPLRSKARSAFRFVGRDLARRVADGTSPDVVVLQEAFTKRSKTLIKKAGYKYVVRGPGQTDKAGRRGKIKPRGKIEIVGEQAGHEKSVGSGLFVLSRFPIIASNTAVFGRTCSGNDCLANKGILHARINVPKLGQPLDILTTHMNANKRREASKKKRLKMHQRQSKIAGAFIREVVGGRSAIFAGDMNIRRPPARGRYFVEQTGAVNAGKLCWSNRATCKTGRNASAKTLWADTNDHQFIIEGRNFRIVPIFMERTYKGKHKGRRLSDHLGFEAVYRISRLGGRQQSSADKTSPPPGQLAAAGWFQLADTDKDKHLTRREYDRRLRLVFALADADNNARLEGDELTDIDPEQVAVFDIDRDRRVTSAEFLAVNRRNFETADRNGNGTLEAAEFATLD